MPSLSIGVLLTCHNRKEQTLRCLAALFGNALPEGVSLAVYLVDDGSTDGTSEAVGQNYPQVHLLQGDGNLFWTGGMHQAFAMAMQHQHDYYLWLNDDTTLYPQALNTLITASQQLVQQGEQRAIVIGSIQDPDDHSLTYGGLVPSTWLHPIRLALVEPTESLQPCHTMNGNCVLIPQEVARRVGNLDTGFRHYLADHDYGLRARQLGCTVWVAPNYAGTCTNDRVANNSGDKRLATAQPLQKITQPKGLLVDQTILYSLEEWKAFTQRHAGPFWFIYWLFPYRRLLSVSFQTLLQQLKRSTSFQI